jgi:N-acetyl-D-muramate 6-phosphate phosphatase
MPLDTARVQALCFDLDGTISDTDDLYVQRAARILSPVEQLFTGFSTQRAARRLVMGLETPGNTIYRILDRFQLDSLLFKLRGSLRPRVDPKSRREYLLIPGVVEMLSELQQHYPLAVVSARDRRSTQDFLDHFDLGRFFQMIVTGETTRYAKPHPDPLLFVSEKLDVLPSQLVMIGDTVVDILAGRAAGSQTVGVLCGFGTEKELRRAGADLILEKTTHLPIALQ